MRVLLINPPVRTNKKSDNYPMSLAYLASYLINKGVDCNILDINCHGWYPEEVVKIIAKEEFDIVGTGGIATTYKYVKWLAHEVKTLFPDKPLILGGLVASPIARLIFKNTPADVVVHGYGEVTLYHLVEAYKNKGDLVEIPGISFLRKGELFYTGHYDFVKHLDELPLPAYDLVEMEFYLKNRNSGAPLDRYIEQHNCTVTNRREITISATRGCTNICAFCVHEKEFPKFKMHSAEYVLNNVKYLYEKYDVRVFHIGEEMVLTKNATLLRNLVKGIEKEEMTDVFFSTTARADTVRAENIEYLREHRFYRFNFGFESADQRILDIILKGTTVEQNIQAYSILKQYSYDEWNTFMVGVPGENIESVNNLIKLIRNHKMKLSGLFYCTPYPGSILYDWALKKGLIKNEDKYLEKVSNRDANLLSINLTYYPDKVLRYFRLKIEFAFFKTSGFSDISLYKKVRKLLSIIKFQLISVYYESYLYFLNILGKDPVKNGLTDGVAEMSKHYKAYTKFVNNRSKQA